MRAVDHGRAQAGNHRPLPPAQRPADLPVEVGHVGEVVPAREHPEAPADRPQGAGGGVEVGRLGGGADHPGEGHHRRPGRHLRPLGHAAHPVHGLGQARGRQRAAEIDLGDRAGTRRARAPAPAVGVEHPHVLAGAGVPPGERGTPVEQAGVPAGQGHRAVGAQRHLGPQGDRGGSEPAVGEAGRGAATSTTSWAT